MGPQKFSAIIMPGILVGIALVCLSLVVYDELIGRPIDTTVQNLLAFLVGLLSSQWSVHQSSQQTLDAVTHIQNGKTE